MVAPWLAEQGLGWIALVLPIVGIVLLVVASIDNIVGTWQGRWGSSLASWAIWAALGWVGFAAQLQLGAIVGAMLLAPIAACPRRWRSARCAPAGSPRRRRSSRGSAPSTSCARSARALALVALVFSTGRQALVLTIVTDAIAAIPTYTAAYRQPDSLPTAPFTASAISAVLTLAAAPSWGFDDAGYAVYLYVMCRGLVWLIRWRRPRWRTAEPVARHRRGCPPWRSRSADHWRPPRSGSSGPSPPRSWWAPRCVGSAVASGMLPMHVTVPGKALPASLPLAG